MLVSKKTILKNFARKVKAAWEKGIVRCPVHLAGGNEKELVEIFKEVKDGDYVFSYHRNMYHALLTGIRPKDLFMEITQGIQGLSGGNSGSMCVCSHDHKFYSTAIVAGGCAIAVGTAYAIKEDGSDAHVWCFIGDGATDEGHFWEALRYAEGWDLPITFVIEDNDRSTCTDNAARWGRAGCDGFVGWSDFKKVRYYKYKATWPHCGSGKYVQF